MLKTNKKITTFKELVEDIKEYLTKTIETKQEAYDNKSDNWQESEKGEEVLEDISNLELLLEATESVEDGLNETYEF